MNSGMAVRAAGNILRPKQAVGRGASLTEGAKKTPISTNPPTCLRVICAKGKNRNIFLKIICFFCPCMVYYLRIMINNLKI